MYHIVICDDDKAFIRCIKEIIIEAGQAQYEFYFSEYESGEEFVSNLDPREKIDLLILDMEMKQMDGDETALRFREIYRESVLVFCSGVRFPTVKSFVVTPYRYLLKSYPTEMLVGEMREVLKEVARQKKDDYLLAHYRKELSKISVRDILYIENAKRGSRLELIDSCEEKEEAKQLLIDEKLNEVEEKYECFVFTHNSFLINLEHLDRVDGTNAFLDNGGIIPVSRKYAKELKLKFARAIAGKY